MPDLCQYLFPSWFGSKSDTCYGGSGCCNHSRCCGWSSVTGFKCIGPHAIPGGLSLKLSNEKQRVLNCPHGDSQALWECGFWIMSKVWFLSTPQPPLFFLFFHDGVNTIWRGSRTLNREHWLVKLFPADASFIWRAGNSLARFSPQSAEELVRYVPPWESECVPICQRVPSTAEPHSRCWLWSLLPWEQNWSITSASCCPRLGLCPHTFGWGGTLEPASPLQSEVCLLLVLVPSSIPPAQVL